MKLASVVQWGAQNYAALSEKLSGSRIGYKSHGARVAYIQD